ncbi:MAG: cytochrome c [Roseiarcus sp.]|jgi:cytochrome c556
MKRWVLAGLALVVGVGAVLADGDAIVQRRKLMKANGEATKTVVAMLKGAPFDLSAVQAALKSYGEAAATAPALFPDDSKTGDTNALPAIWDDKADVDARFAKLAADVKAASAGIVDEASFKAQMPALLKNCGGCHELYRAKKS